MAKTWNAAAMALGVPGFLMQSLGLFEGRLWLGILGTALLVLALALYFKARHRNPLSALWGVVPIMGVIVCLASREQGESTTRQAVENILIEEDPHIRTLRELKKSTVVGGRPFLLVMAPLGLLLLLFGPQLPYVAMRQQAALTEPPQTTAPAPDHTAPGPARVPAETERKSAETVAPARPAEPVKPAIADEPVESPTQPPDAPKETESLTPQEMSSVARFKRIQKGMSYEQVTDIMGTEGKVVSDAEENRLIQWKNPDGSYFAAAFDNNALHRTTGLHFPPPPEEPAPEPADQSGEPTTEEPEPAAAEPAPDQADETDIYVAGELPEPDEYEDQPFITDEELIEIASGQDVPQQRGRVVGPQKEPDMPPRGGRGAYKKPRLPRYVTSVRRGPHDVHIINPNDFTANVGLRSGKRGKDFTIPPGGATTLYLPNGPYKLYYLRADEPDDVQHAPAFTVDSPTEAIVLRLGD